ncbi:polysaccharide deacetylase family protein [Sphingobacterium sp. lm-10]|uniref:polysaccharide deacetylase family protein n=1 Tax=Sphingobacterium sp. lm-10 TaxID=2944904 RepID=UPI00201FCC20|nr:polysaccharide deacetylase family protein [Sphingobacterium sp. lm-10]MCL7987551.1 polysaccharide deacetylase family protein [Sphingobacterium sp. lm-10]
MHIVKAPFLLRSLYPEATWNRSRKEKKIYLTFDDGPIPEVTPWILDTLKDHQVKATFFCVGENVQKNGSILQRLMQEGHAVGNHTMQHLRGWDTPHDIYLENVEACQKLIDTQLFRPPYGRAKKSQLKALKEKYEIVMWDVLTGDYDPKISPEQCLKNAIKYTKNGSIIVFHDNVKSFKNVQYALPRMIEYLQKKGYEFSLL